MKMLASLLAAGVMVMATGCAGETGDDGEAAGDEPELTKATVGASAVAVEIHTIPMTNKSVKDATITVAGSKLSKLTRALKRRSASEPVPRCMPGFRREFRFLDAQGQETSKGSVSCGGIGQLVVGGQTIAIKIDDMMEAIATAPLVPADALWGISQVEVTKPGRGFTKKVDDGAEIAKLLGAIDGDQAIVPIDPHAPVARCLPSFVVKFMRGTKEAASTSFNCGSGEKVHATFGIGDATRGTIEVTTKPFEDLAAGKP